MFRFGGPFRSLSARSFDHVYRVRRPDEIHAGMGFTGSKGVHASEFKTALTMREVASCSVVSAVLDSRKINPSNRRDSAYTKRGLTRRDSANRSTGVALVGSSESTPFWPLALEAVAFGAGTDSGRQAYCCMKSSILAQLPFCAFYGPLTGSFSLISSGRSP